MSKSKKTYDKSQELVTEGFLRETLDEFRVEIKEQFENEFLKQNTLIAESFVTKSEWARDMDQIMGVLKAIQEDLAASLYRQQGHSDTLEKHERRLQVIESRQRIPSPTTS